MLIQVASAATQVKEWMRALEAWLPWAMTYWQDLRAATSNMFVRKRASRFSSYFAEENRSREINCRKARHHALISFGGKADEIPLCECDGQ